MSRCSAIRTFIPLLTSAELLQFEPLTKPPPFRLDHLGNLKSYMVATDTFEVERQPVQMSARPGRVRGTASGIPASIEISTSRFPQKRHDVLTAATAPQHPSKNTAKSEDAVCYSPCLASSRAVYIIIASASRQHLRWLTSSVRTEQ